MVDCESTGLWFESRALQDRKLQWQAVQWPHFRVSFARPMIGVVDNVSSHSPLKAAFPCEKPQVTMCLAGASNLAYGCGMHPLHPLPGMISPVISVYVAGIMVNELWQASSLGWWVWMLVFTSSRLSIWVCLRYCCAPVLCRTWTAGWCHHHTALSRPCLLSACCRLAI